VKIVVFVEADEHNIVDWLAVLRILEDPGLCLLFEHLYYVFHALLQFIQAIAADSRPNFKSVIITGVRIAQSV
jgi:hypothetical protein